MKRILIVEDDPAIALVEKDYLELAGFSVQIEKTGVEGLKRALEMEFDLLILDLMLPGIDGFGICQKVREVREVPIIMISARDEDLAKMRGFELGLDDYLTKPFSPNELVARVKARLMRYEKLTGKGGEERILEDRGLTIDLESRRVFVNGDEKALTNREFDVLTVLVSNPNRVFSREELFEKLWDLSAEGDLSTVTVHIRRIREKIEFDPSAPARIATVWGIGYRYVR